MFFGTAAARWSAAEIYVIGWTAGPESPLNFSGINGGDSLVVSTSFRQEQNTSQKAALRRHRSGSMANSFLRARVLVPPNSATSALKWLAWIIRLQSLRAYWPS